MRRRKINAAILASATLGGSARSAQAADSTHLELPAPRQEGGMLLPAEGLGSVFRAAVDHPKLTAALKLPAEQFITFAQTVGYPPGK